LEAAEQGRGREVWVGCGVHSRERMIVLKRRRRRRRRRNANADFVMIA